MMHTNNYDRSSTGMDIEVTAFLSTDEARERFAETLENVAWINRNSGLFAFTDCGQIEPPDSVLDCYDIAACTHRDWRAFALAYERCEPNSAHARDILRDRHRSGLSWEEYATDYFQDVAWADIARDGFPAIPGARLLWDVEHVSGYSQGDYAWVLVRTDQDWQPSRQCLEHLFYDAPVCLDITVDGKEFFPEFPDEYAWDKTEALAACKAAGVPERAMPFIKSALPDVLDYE